MTEPYVKNLGQVAAVVFSNTAPKYTKILWFDLTNEVLKIYSRSLNLWIPLLQAIEGAENAAGEGTGLVFKEIRDSILSFRRIKGGRGVSVNTETNDIVIELKSFLEGSPNPIVLESTAETTKKFVVSSNVSWQLIIPAELISETGWLDFSVQTGFGYAEVTLTVTNPNPSQLPRSNSFLLKDLTGELEDQEIVVTQVGSDSFVGMFIQNSSDFICQTA